MFTHQQIETMNQGKMAMIEQNRHKKIQKSSIQLETYWDQQ